MGFSRQEHWSGLPFPSPGGLPYPGIEPGSPVSQADSLPSEPSGKPPAFCISWGWTSGTLCVLPGVPPSPQQLPMRIPGPLLSTQHPSLPSLPALASILSTAPISRTIPVALPFISFGLTFSILMDYYTLIRDWLIPWKWRESEVTQSCPTLCDLMDCSLPGSSAHGIFKARILEWVVILVKILFYSFSPYQKNDTASCLCFYGSLLLFQEDECIFGTEREHFLCASTRNHWLLASHIWTKVLDSIWM